MFKHKYLLYGGAAGGGKSYFLRWALVYALMYFFAQYGLRGVRVGLFCEDYPALKDRHLSKIPFEFPQWLGTLNKSEHEFRLNEAYGGGVIAFRNLDDTSKYLSSEFAIIAIDELTRNERDVFDFLIMRLRWAGLPSKEYRFISASNPGSRGHGWVKKLWIDRNFDDEALDKTDFIFVQAKSTDNKHLPEGYDKQLATLPETLRKAYRDGDWNVFQGKYFPEFSRNNEKLVRQLELNEDVVYWGGMDWGSASPLAYLFLCIFPDSTIYVFDEIYVKPKDLLLTDEDVAKQIKDRWNDKQVYTVGDSAMWSQSYETKTGQYDSMIAQEYVKNGVNLVACLKSPTQRVDDLQRIKGLFMKGKLVISPNCTSLIKELEDIVHDDKKVEDIDTNAVDHAIDALRYALQMVPAPIVKFDPTIPISDKTSKEEHIDNLVKQHKMLQNPNRVDIWRL